MKILIVTQYFWPENFRINDLALGLKQRGHEITVLTGIPNYPEGKFFRGYGFLGPRRENYNGINIIRVPILPRGKSKGYNLALNYFSYAFFASLLGYIQCRGDFDLIFVAQYSPFTVGIPAVFLKWLKKVPIMFWIQDLWPESLSATNAIRSRILLRCVEKLVRLIYRHCDRILVQSKRFIQSIGNMGVNEDRIYYLPNWAGESQERAEREVTKQALPQGFRLIFAGNIGAAQDFETIIAAMEKIKEYPDIHLVVLGEGRLFARVKEEIKSKSLENNVHLLGRRPLSEMPDYFAQADAMLVTLKAEPIFTLTVPTKVQSYLASGKPIVAALEGEGANIIREAGAGLTCACSNAEALSEIILEMYNKPKNERQLMGQKGYQYYKNNFEYNMLMDRVNNWVEDFRRKDR